GARGGARGRGPPPPRSPPRGGPPARPPAPRGERPPAGGGPPRAPPNPAIGRDSRYGRAHRVDDPPREVHGPAAIPTADFRAAAEAASERDVGEREERGGARVVPRDASAVPAARSRDELEAAGLVLDQTALEREPSRVAALSPEALRGWPRGPERAGRQGHVLAMAAVAELEGRRIAGDPRQDAHGAGGSGEPDVAAHPPVLAEERQRRGVGVEHRVVRVRAV